MSAIFNSIDTSIRKAPRCPKGAPAHYAAMHAEARSVGWPESYAGDLTTWDRLALTGSAVEHEKGERITKMNPIGVAEPFGWVLRKGGTHIMEVFGAATCGASRQTSAASIARAFGDNECRFYQWDGYLLRHADAASLDAWIARVREEREALPETICSHPHCGVRWSVAVKDRHSGAVRSLCIDHTPAGKPCVGCGCWIGLDDIRARFGDTCPACQDRGRTKRARRVAP